MSPPPRTHHPDTEPTRRCSFSLSMRAQRRGNKYEFYSLCYITTHQCLTLIHANHLTCTYCLQAVGQKYVSKVPTPVAINADPHAETHAVCPIPE